MPQERRKAILWKFKGGRVHTQYKSVDTWKMWNWRWSLNCDWEFFLYFLKLNTIFLQTTKVMIDCCNKFGKYKEATNDIKSYKLTHNLVYHPYVVMTTFFFFCIFLQVLYYNNKIWYFILVIYHYVIIISCTLKFLNCRVW